MGFVGFRPLPVHVVRRQHAMICDRDWIFEYDHIGHTVDGEYVNVRTKEKKSVHLDGIYVCGSFDGTFMLLAPSVIAHHDLKDGAVHMVADHGGPSITLNDGNVHTKICGIMMDEPKCFHHTENGEVVLRGGRPPQNEYHQETDSPYIYEWSCDMLIYKSITDTTTSILVGDLLDFRHEDEPMIESPFVHHCIKEGILRSDENLC